MIGALARLELVLATVLSLVEAAAPLNYSVIWVGNSSSGASNPWVQNLQIDTKVQPDGTVNLGSHGDGGGKKFGVYRDGEVMGNTNVNPHSRETRDQAGRLRIFRFDGDLAIPSGRILQWGHGLDNTDRQWPPHKPASSRARVSGAIQIFSVANSH